MFCIINRLQPVKFSIFRRSELESNFIFLAENIISSACSCLVLNTILYSRILAFLHRPLSFIKTSAINNRQSIGFEKCPLLRVAITAPWHLSTLPSCRHHCRATPTDILPFLGIPVSSIDKALSSYPPSSLSLSRAI